MKSDFIFLSMLLGNHYRKTYKEFIASIRYRTKLKARYHQERLKFDAIKKQSPKILCPEEILDNSDLSARKCLAKILGTSQTSSAKLIERMGSLSQGIIGRTLGNKPEYKQIVDAACQKLNLPKPLSPNQGEEAIAIHCFKEVYQKLTPSQQRDYEAALRNQSATLKKLYPSLAPSMISATAIIAGKMSGFGVYVAASTLVGAVTSTIGMTLPFVFYTTMSSAISIFLGPVGWLTVGAMVVSTLFGSDFSKVTQGIILIASIRAEKELEWKALLTGSREQLKKTSREVCDSLIKTLSLLSILLAYWLSLPSLVFLIIFRISS